MYNAKQECLAEGLEQVLERRKQEGLAKGEYNAKLETARKMLAKGLNIELVSQCTGLSIEILQSLNK